MTSLKTISRAVVGDSDPLVRTHVFNRVEFRRARRERQERDVGGHLQLRRDMPACLVEQQHRMGAWRDRLADLRQLGRHRLSIAVGQDETRTLAFGRADRPEDVGPGGPLVVRR